jgi:hypothetical protein
MAEEEIQISAADFMQAAVNALAGTDHKAVPVSAENWTRDWAAVCDAMEADGYVFYCSPAADERGVRMIYFVREPEPGYRI